MQINENLLKTFVKAMNVQKDKETRLYYGTIVDVVTINNERIAYVHLDGSESDMRTPVVEGTEVMKDDRVVVTIENHKAVVISNITSPASARTAKNYMDLIEEGLVIGEITGTDEDPPQSIVIGSLSDDEEGVYLRIGGTIIASFVGDEAGYSKIEFGPFHVQDSQDEYFAFLNSLGLNIYLNYGGGDVYDAATRIRPGYLGINDILGNYIEMKNGSVNAENGCNTNIVYVSVSSASTISVNHGAAYSGSIQAVVPTGYTPCGIVKRQILGQPYYFTYLEVDNTGNISYTIYNASSSDGTDISVHFTIACAFTG